MGLDVPPEPAVASKQSVLALLIFNSKSLSKMANGRSVFTRYIDDRYIADINGIWKYTLKVYYHR